MSRTITEGDTVTVFTAESGEAMTQNNMEVIHVAGASGELWYFKDENGDIWGYNPSSSNFVGVRKVAE